MNKKIFCPFLSFIFFFMLTGSILAWEWPAVSKYITSDFGPRISPTTNAWDFHEGVDISAYYTIVYAVDSGIVKRPYIYEVNPSNDDLLSAEGIIEIEHSNGMHSRYLHCSKSCVKKGDNVRSGEIIGLSGERGAWGRPHLHFDFGYYPEDGPHPLKYLPYDNTTVPYVYRFTNLTYNQVISGTINLGTEVLTTFDKDLNEFRLRINGISIGSVSYDPKENCASNTVIPCALGDDIFNLGDGVGLEIFKFI